MSAGLPPAVRRIVAEDVGRHRWQAVGAVACVLVSAAAVALGPVVLRDGIDDGILAGDRGALRVAVAASAGLLVVAGAFGGVRSVLMIDLAQGFLHRLRVRAVAGLLGRDLARFEASPRGDLQARLGSDIESLGDASQTLLPDIVRDLVLVIGGLVAIWVLAPLLLVLAALVLPPAVLAGRWLARRGAVVYPALLEANGVALGHLAETIEGAPTLAALRAERVQLDRVDESSAELVRANLAAASMRNRFYATLLALQALGTATVVVGAGLLVGAGQTSDGTAAAAVLALAAVYGPLSLMIGRVDELLAVRAALVRVAELAGDAPPPASTASRSARAGELRIDDVSYTYPGAAEPALSGVSLRASAGEHVALVGVTGSGKSTLGRLAAGLAEPGRGTVRLDGVDLGDLVPADRSGRLVLVPQEPFLFAGTIAGNVALMGPAQPGADVEQAAEDLGLGAWLAALPNGADTRVEGLSDGERQLVTLLLVALADPFVVVLDEATSVLDRRLEDLVATALAQLGEGRVTLVIAHRPETAARCDRIVVLDGGRLVAEGTHAELAADPAGPYARLSAVVSGTAP